MLKAHGIKVFFLEINLNKVRALKICFMLLSAATLCLAIAGSATNYGCFKAFV